MSTSFNAHQKKVSSTPWLTLVGVNENGVAGLCDQAKQAIRDAEHVFGGKRHLELVSELIQGHRQTWQSPFAHNMSAISALKGSNIVVLASGDPFYYGVGSVLVRDISMEEMTVFPAPSCVTQACQTLGWAQQDVRVVSLCGRPLESLKSSLVEGNRLIILTSDNESPQQIAQYLVSNGCGRSPAILLEALGGKHQKVRQFTPNYFDIAASDINPLNLVAIDRVACESMEMSLAPGRPSTSFTNDGQITREEIRALSLAKLRPKIGQLLWDLGAGSGAVSVEWLLLSPHQQAVAVETNAERLSFVRQNSVSYGVSDRLKVVEGHLPDVLSSMEGNPDAVFVGGGASTSLIEQIVARINDGGRLVVNAVTLETEQLLIESHARYGGSLTRIGLENASPLGKQWGWSPARTITQWCWQKGISTAE